MTSRSVRLYAMRGSIVLMLAFALVLMGTMSAGARLDQFGGAAVVVPYAPYTAGPVVDDRPYAPYTAGPVVREEFRPYAPYTAGPVVREEFRPYAPYTAGPVVTPSDLPYAPYTAGPVVRESDKTPDRIGQFLK